MATFDQIKEVRLTVDDPSGFVNLVSVADLASLPAAPLAQTAYFVVAVGGYYATEKASGATSADYTLQEISISDARISASYDSKGFQGAVRDCYSAIIAKLGKQLLMVKNSDGAESTEFQRILDLQKFYRQAYSDFVAGLEDIAQTNSGLIVQFAEPVIASGNV